MVVDEKRKPSCAGKEDHTDLEDLMSVSGRVFASNDFEVVLQQNGQLDIWLEE